MAKKILLALAGIGALVVAAIPIIRSSYDEPEFKSVHASNPFEIRAYGSRIVAQTTVRASSLREATTLGFERLAEYIFGGNRGSGGASQKIAMTTPVESVPAGENAYTVVFTMPSEWTLDELPEPNDPNVVVRAEEPRLVATARFSGNASERDVDELSRELMVYIEEQGYVADSEVTIAQYDPPWTPGIMRRNEMMVELAEPRAPGTEAAPAE
ncbi:heme-binding protein [Lujinxingia vulgaris]|uniref:Heme-binding protein n=1 Tax=Lujinxingia vulgaris TaxID=2600176 RepID=A0A5C6XR76_9DELT|nr:heme-binding protein [Lujinxingia vulgaris]TXD44242.1 heme-binding protein [Lujinxingia vulgaris]